MSPPAQTRSARHVAASTACRCEPGVESTLVLIAVACSALTEGPDGRRRRCTWRYRCAGCGSAVERPREDAWSRDL